MPTGAANAHVYGNSITMTLCIYCVGATSREYLPANFRSICHALVSTSSSPAVAEAALASL